MSKRASWAAALALLAALPGSAFAQARSFVAISTPDVERAAAWYQRHLDLRPVPETRPRPPGDPIQLRILEGDLAIVELVQNADARPPIPREVSRRHGIFKAGLVVDDIDSWLARWRRDGVTIEASFCWRGRPMAVILDGEGNALQILQRDPAQPAAEACAQNQAQG